MNQKFDEYDSKLAEKSSKDQDGPPAKKAKQDAPPNSAQQDPQTSTIDPEPSLADRHHDSYDDYYGEEDLEYLNSGEELISEDVYQEIYSGKDDSLTAQVIFDTKEVPHLLANSRIAPPSTKNGNFSICFSDRIICLAKGIKQSNLAFPRFDAKSRDTAFNRLLSHVNSKYLVTDVPDDCFRIATNTRTPLAATYKTLSRQQTVLKSLLIHAELMIDQFQSADKNRAQELTKLYILPIDAQIENINDTLRRIRSIALPKFLPLPLRRAITYADILPEKIWNIPPHLQSQILTARTEYSKRLYSRPSTSRDPRPFQQRGRTSDRRARPQRRGGYPRRRFDSKQENQRSTKPQ